VKGDITLRQYVCIISEVWRTTQLKGNFCNQMVGSSLGVCMLAIVDVNGCLQKNARTPHIYIYAHEFPLAINAVTTADLVVACAYVVGRACMMSKMRMPQTLSKFRYVESPARQARCSRHPCEKIMKVHMHANQIVRARTCTAKTRLPPRLTSA